MENSSSDMNILAYAISDSLSYNHFGEINNAVPVNSLIYLPVINDNGVFKIGIQSYLQYAINEEIDNFGINLKSSIYNDPFSVFTLIRPDSSFSKIAIKYVSY